MLGFITPFELSITCLVHALDCYGAGPFLASKIMNEIAIGFHAADWTRVAFLFDAVAAKVMLAHIRDIGSELNILAGSLDEIQTDAANEIILVEKFGIEDKAFLAAKNFLSSGSHLWLKNQRRILFSFFALLMRNFEINIPIPMFLES
jgi:hypothetical protein